MPNLTTCSQKEWDAALPGIARPAAAAAATGGDAPLAGGRRRAAKMAPLRAYEKAMRKQVQRGIIPGFCSIVIWGDQVLHVDAHGYADLERKSPMRTDTIVRLYCMGKSIVATALLLLVERGQCALEDDVASYIPAFAKTRVVAKPLNDAVSAEDRPPVGTLTLRRLLCHCSGLGYGKEFNYAPEGAAERSYHRLVLAVESGRVKNIAAFCDELAALPLRREPGAAFEYSYGLDVIGRIIEVVSGQPLDVFLEESLFRPLGMHDTGFSVPQDKLPQLAALYGSIGTARALREVPMSQQLPVGAPEWSLTRLDGQRPENSAWAMGGCPVLSGGGLMGHNRGGLVSTLNDQARFFLMLARGGALPGGPRILKEETVRAMVGSDWLRMPECLGAPQTNTGLGGVTAAGLFGWNALGELGVNEKTGTPDEFELHEYGYAGIAETFWSINPSRDLVILWFSQQVDNRSWTSPAGNLWAAARRAVSGKAALGQEPAARKRTHSEAEPEEKAEAAVPNRSIASDRISAVPLGGGGVGGCGGGGTDGAPPPPQRRRLSRKGAEAPRG